MNDIKKIQDEINQVVHFHHKKTYSKDEVITGSALVQFNTLCDNLIKAENDLEKIKALYKEYYNKTKGTSSFLTMNPESEISKAILKITVDIADKFKISPLSLLLPNTQIHFVSDDRYNIEDKKNWDEYVSYKGYKNSLQTLIAFYQQHFYGADNLVNVDNIISFPIKNLKQVYEYKETYDPKRITVNSDFFERILNSNSLIREAYNLENEIKEVEESGHSLKAELIKLANALFDNGVNGRYGSEGYAGVGASIAIGEFRGKWESYYKDDFLNLISIGTSENRQAMEKLVTQIRQLDDGSCVDLKSKALKAVIKELESILDKEFIETKDSKRNEETLKKLNNRYKEITAEIGKLQNEGKIKTIDALPLDLTCFFQNGKLIMKSVYDNAESINISDLETILQQVSDISVDEMNQEDIFGNILLYPKHFLAIWNRLSDEAKQEIQKHIKEDENIYKAIANQINDPHTTGDLKERLLNITINVLTKDGDSFYKIYSNLDDSNKNNYFEAVKTKLPSITNTGDDFKNIYKLLDTFFWKSERNSYFEAVKTKLPSITNTGDDFKKIYDLLDTFFSKSELISYFQTTKCRLPSITNTGDDFKKIYNTLSDGVDLSSIFNGQLPTSDRNRYFNAVNNNLASITNTRNDFEDIYKLLDSFLFNSYTNNYVDAIKDKLPSLTKTRFDFCRFYETLDVRYRNNYVNAIKDKLPSLTKTRVDCYNIYSTLEAEYRKEYLRTLTLTTLKDSNWFESVLQDIELLDKKTALLESLCNKSSQNVKKIFGYGGTNIQFNGQVYNVTDEVAETLNQDFLNLVKNKDVSYEAFQGCLRARLKECASNQCTLKSSVLRSSEDEMLYQALERDENQHNPMNSYLRVS